MQITELQNTLWSETCYRQIVVQNVTVLSSLYEAMTGICFNICITVLQNKSEKNGRKQEKVDIIMQYICDKCSLINFMKYIQI